MNYIVDHTNSDPYGDGRKPVAPALNHPRREHQNSLHAREDWQELHDHVSEIIALAKNEGRDLKPSEAAECDNAHHRMDLIRAEIGYHEDRERRAKAGVSSGGTPSVKRPGWVSSGGKPVNVLNRAERWSDLPGHFDECGIGYVIKAIAQGHWKNIPDNVRNALAGNNDTAGGVMVPSQLLGSVIDKARAMSVVMQAGATTIPMESDAITIARVAGDPSFESKVENAAFTSTDITFDSVNMSAHLIGNYIKASRELMEDAPNAVEVTESTLARALAAELDRQFLRGSASAELLGIVNKNGIGATGSVGAIAWEDLHTGVVDIWGNNHEPNAWVASPTIFGDLSILAAGDGSNSAKSWLGPPPSVEPLAAFKTSNLTDANVVIGDFNTALIGLRQGVRIELSTEAGTAFEKHQMWIKVTWRGSFALSDETAWHVLSGVTT